MKRRKSSVKNTRYKTCTCETCDEFIPIGEGDHICGVDPTMMPVSDYMPTEDYCWCGGRSYVSKGR